MYEEKGVELKIPRNMYLCVYIRTSVVQLVALAMYVEESRDQMASRVPAPFSLRTIIGCGECIELTYQLVSRQSTEFIAESWAWFPKAR